MDMTQQDLDARAQRVAAGVGTDEDSRLIKQYQRAGWSVSDSGAQLEGEDGPEVDAPAGQPVDAPHGQDDADPDDGATETAHGRGRSGRGAKAR